MAAAAIDIVLLSGERGSGKSSAARSLARLVRGSRGLEGVAGVLTRSLRGPEGLPMELELEDLATGESRPLASRSRDLGGPRLEPGAARASPPSPPAGPPGPPGPPAPPAPPAPPSPPAGPPASPAAPPDFRPPPPSRPAPFSFSASTIAWALGLLEAGLASPASLLVVDEIGPLELDLGQGFAPFLDAVAALARGTPARGDPARGAPEQRPGGRRLVLLTVRPSLAEELAARLAPAIPRVELLGPENRDAMPELLASLLGSPPFRRYTGITGYRGGRGT